MQQGGCKLWISSSTVGAQDYFSLSSLTSAAYKLLEDCVIERADGVGGHLIVGPKAVLELHLGIFGVWGSYQTNATAFRRINPGEVLRLPAEWR